MIVLMLFIMDIDIIFTDIYAHLNEEVAPRLVTAVVFKTAG